MLSISSSSLFRSRRLHYKTTRDRQSHPALYSGDYCYCYILNQPLNPATMRVPDDIAQEAEEPRKRTRVGSASRKCYDWMVITGNCHYARDQASFKTYRPVARQIKSNIFNPFDELQVAGVGTVELELCKSPQDLSSHTVVLENVLHIPEAVCNGFSPLLLGTSMSCNEDCWVGGDTMGNPVWLSTPFAGGTKLALAGNPQGESEMIQGRYYTLCLRVSPEEWQSILAPDDMNGIEP